MSDLCPRCGADPTAVEALRARVAEVEREIDEAHAQIDALTSARESVAMLIPLGEATGPVERDIADYVARLTRERDAFRLSLFASQKAWTEVDNRVRVLEPEIVLLRSERDEARRERDAAILRHDEDLGRMQRVVYDALCAAVKDALPDEPLSRIDGAGSDGDEFDFTEAEVSIACGMLTDALDEARREIAASRAHVIALEQQNVALLRWQSVAADAHIDHLCAIVRSLAVSDETPRVLRDLSAMGVEEEIRRAFAAERINRAKSEATVTVLRKERDDMSAELQDLRQSHPVNVPALLPALDTIRAASATGSTPAQLARMVEDVQMSMIRVPTGDGALLTAKEPK